MRAAAALAVALTCVPAVAHARQAASPGQAAGDGSAPPSRAALLEAARRAKAAELEPPRRGFIEGLLYRSEQNLLAQKVAAGYGGFHIVSGEMPTGNGLDMGVGYADPGLGVAYPAYDTPNRVEVETRALYSTRRYRQAEGRIAWHEIGGTPLALSVYGTVFRWPRRDFFGRGVDTSPDDKSTYAEDGTEVGVDAWMRLGLRSRVGVGLHALDPDTGPGTDSDHPVTQEVFGPDQAPGLDADADFRRFDVFAELDLRDSPTLPRAGGRYSFRFSDYDDTLGHAFSFRRYEVDLQQYVPFEDRRKVFAFRALGVISDPRGDGDVPVYLWPTLGSSRRMRGYASARLQDRDILLLSAEYRWQVWWVLDAALFLDLGNATMDPGDLTRGMKPGYGFGLRLHSLEALLARLDLAHSDDGFYAHFSFTYPFDRGGMTR